MLEKIGAQKYNSLHQFSGYPTFETHDRKTSSNYIFRFYSLNSTATALYGACSNAFYFSG
jgi:hypothetical protein